MKILAQDGMGAFEFENVFANNIPYPSVWIQNGTNARMIGRYEDVYRAVAVVADILGAYVADEKVFYMPKE